MNETSTPPLSMAMGDLSMAMGDLYIAAEMSCCPLGERVPQRRIQEPKKGGSACRSQHHALLRARYATIVTYYCDLEKGGSVEPPEPPLDPPLYPD